MPTYSETHYWLALINESNLKLNIIKPIIQRWCLVDNRPLAEIFSLSPLEWATMFGLEDAEVEQVLAVQQKVERQAGLVKQWQAEGIEPLIRTDPRYPKRLIQALAPAHQPLILWARGTLNLLNEPVLATLGNEAPDEEIAQFLDDLMQTLVREDIGLISGYGRGLDRSAFESMLQTDGGRAIVMIPMGLRAFAKTTAKLEPAVASGNVVVVSPFAPETPYQERLAEARSLLIDHLALALLILDTNDEAKTRAVTALNRGLPVFVSLTDTSHNRALLDQGALLLTDAGEVVEMVQQAIIDVALLPENVEPVAPIQPAASLPASPSSASLTDPTEDFSLRFEEVEPLETEEALEVLSLGGEIPELLRRRLEQKSDEEVDT